MISLLWFIIITLIAYGLGRLLLGLFMEKSTPWEEFPFAVGIGLALLGYMVYAIGSAGLLYLKYIVIMLLISGIVAMPGIYRFISSFRIKDIIKTITALSSFEKFLLAVISSIFIISIFGAMAPAIGNDTLAYHFQHPKIFIQEHRIGYIPFTRESMWPYLMEMLFTLGLILKSAAVAKMLHLIFGVLTALAVFSFTSRFFSKKYALLAATLFYSAPGIFMQSTYAYTDLATCFYSFSGLYCLLLWLQKERMRLLLLSGIFIGLIFSIKILGIMALMASVSVILYASIGKKRSLRVSAGNLSILCVSALLVSCIWYIRSYVVLGNPVYPFLYSIFKSGWEVDISKYVYASSRGVVEFLRLPWDIVMNIDNFGGEQIGVIFLAFLPVLFFLNFKDKVLRPLLIFLAVYTVAWYCVTPTIRFAFVNYALIYIFIAIGFYKATEKYRLSILKLLLCLCILFNLSLCIYYNRDAIKLQLTAMTEEEYLLQNERTYAIAKFVNKNLPSNSVLIAAEPRLYYFDRKVIAYKMLYRFYGKNLSDYIYKLRRDKIPVYFLCSSNSDCKGIEPFIKDKVPVYKVSSKIQTDERVDYRLYKL